MSKIILRILVSVICLSLASPCLAANLSRVSGKALVVNTGNTYLDFSNYNSNVKVDNGSGNWQGYAWLQDAGWCDFGSEVNASGPVKVDMGSGVVSGRAYCANTLNYIYFSNYNSNVSLNTVTKAFSGYAWSTDVGWLNFADTGVSLGAAIGLSQVSPKEYTQDTKPTLVFKKATNVAGNVSSYTVSLDEGKNRSFSSISIPGSAGGGAATIWKDDGSVKIEFFYENDTDTGNDEIRVWFKDLDKGELTEGNHTWKVIVYGNQNDEAEFSADFYVDKTKPGFNDLAIEKVSGIKAGQAYSLSMLSRLPSFSGQAFDLYQAGVSSGPEKIILTIKKQNSDFSYTEYLSREYDLTNIKDQPDKEKSSRFFITTPFNLKDGYYQVVLGVKDKADNKYEQPAFFLKMNYFGLGGILSWFNTLGSEEQKTEESLFKEPALEQEKNPFPSFRPLNIALYGSLLLIISLLAFRLKKVK